MVIPNKLSYFCHQQKQLGLFTKLWHPYLGLCGTPPIPPSPFVCGSTHFPPCQLLSVQGQPPHNKIYTGLLSVCWYIALIWQSPMNAMCWLECRIYHDKVIIHPADPGVYCLVRQVNRLCREYYLLILSAHSSFQYLSVFGWTPTV